jgi:hypothetical protein
LRAAGHPDAEILHVRSLHQESKDDASARTPIHAWEAPEVPHTFDPDDVYYLLEQSLSPSKPRTELHVSFDPWRMNAYARMPAARLATHTGLTEFVRLHGSKRAQDANTWVEPPLFVKSTHRREHQLQGGVFCWGDEFTIDMERGPSSESETWLVGALLSRALSERSERLRFVQLTLKQAGSIVAKYDERDGERLPFPFG